MRALLHCEGAEPPQFDPLAASQSGGDLVEDRRNDLFTLVNARLRVDSRALLLGSVPLGHTAPASQAATSLCKAGIVAARSRRRARISIGT